MIIACQRAMSHRPSMVASRAVAVALLVQSTSALSQLGPCASLNTLCVGADSGCQYSSIQQAINAAPTSSGVSTAIHVARNQTYTAQNLLISGRNVLLRGGYDSCGDYFPSGTTTVSGEGGGGASAITIDASGGFRQVTLRNLEIRAGGSEDHDFGGGVRVIDGALEIRDSTITQNVAKYGGGVYASGATVVLSAGARLSQNTAIEGGGLYCGNGEVQMTDADIAFNTAKPFFSGDLARGGGVALANCDFTATASGAGRGLRSNQAESGGGAIAAGQSSIELHGAGGGSFQLVNNQAGVGGALHLSYSSADLYGTLIEGNIAGDGFFTPGFGAGIFAFRSHVGVVAEPGCTGCSITRGNVAGNGGAFVYVTGTASDPSDVFVADTLITGNFGTPIGIEGDNSGASAQFYGANVLASNNEGNSVLFLYGGASAEVIASTVADNTVATVVNTQQTASVRLFADLVREAPGTPLVTSDTSGASVNTGCLMLNSGNGMPPDQTQLTSDTPGFVDGANGNYRLRVDSRAIDFCPYLAEEMPVFDLDGNPRGVDAPHVAPFLLNATFDLGAYEWTMTDPIFADGFE